MFRKLLIANRGEIACRIIRTARHMGISTVAVFSEADQHSLHVEQADEAYCIGPAAAADSYLNIVAIIGAAQRSGADAIHPGYGFLSENAEFAKACEQAKIVFIGPSIPALEMMGSKLLAKQHLANSAVPLIPGYHGEDQSDLCLQNEAQKIGFPLLIKAANGGGGKGMREVHHAADFLTELAAARREALAYFADDTIILEKLVQNPRHVEIQIMADNFGNVVHLFERDCSIQRRHQKVIEEAPAAQLDERLRQQMTDAAITVAKTIAYRGAGTVECLVENNQQFYFMEMNTRLQVEHPVTEMITGLDLVAWQIHIAANAPLPCTQADIVMHGHAIECRVYAEDPNNQFLPSTGQIRFLKTPEDMQVRIDTGVTTHSNISMYYDPMLAKIIARGANRAEAIQRLIAALQHYHLGGVKTNQSFLLSILQHPAFAANAYTTHFLNDVTLETAKINWALALSMAVAIDYAALQSHSDPLHQDSFGWQMYLQTEWTWHYRYQETCFSVRIAPRSLHQFEMTFLNLEAPASEWNLSCTADRISIVNQHEAHHCYYEHITDNITLYLPQGAITLQQKTYQQHQSNATMHGQLTAPMPGTIVAILKQVGDTVASGDALLILEAMKMEHTIRAPYAGKVQEIFYSVGAQVPDSVTLVALESL